MVQLRNKFNVAVKKNKEDFYELLQRYFPDTVLNKKESKVQKNNTRKLPFVKKSRNLKKGIYKPY